MAEHIKSILAQFLKTKKRESADIARIGKIVSSNLGPKVSRYVRLDRIYKRKMFFSAGTSSALYEFGLKKYEILGAVKKEFPQIEDAKIKIG